MSRKGRFSRISSFSSEDPNHPASNLLTPETFRKWKCKEPGEKAAFVIIQLDKVEKIISIDVGNESSAFIELSVARSGGDTPEFQVIQNQTAFMTPSESKAETNQNRVRMFSSSLVKTVVAEKWDLVKVSCIQPFSRVQYGISFINVIVERDPSEPVTIGGFRMLTTPAKDDFFDAVDDDPIRIGSFFAKKMEAGGQNTKGAAEKPRVTSCNAITSSSLAATIRAATTPPSSSVARIDKKPNDTAHGTSKFDTDDAALSRRNAKDASSASGSTFGKQFGNQISGSGVQSPKGLSTTSKTNGTTSGTSKGGHLNVNPKKIQSPTSTPQQKIHSSPKPTAPLRLRSTPSTSTSTITKPPLKRKQSITKPFDKLFEGVVFVISGYENPYRSELRRKAVEMGGQCKPDWNPSCTHLICAFVNTPKFRQVKGSRNGKIVTKKWIEDSHREKCRFPWRRYCLDKADKGNESEEEVHATGESSESEESNEGYTLAVNILNSPESGVIMDQDSNSTREPEDGDETDFEEEVENDDDILISPRSANGKPSGGRDTTKRRRVARISSSSSSSSDDAAYDVDTEVDEPQVSPTHTNDFSISDAESNQGRHRHNKCNDFFNSMLFFLHPTHPGDQDQRKRVETIIRQHKGSLTTTFNGDVDYIVTGRMKWMGEFTQLLAQSPDVVVVGEDWIEKCGETNEMALIEPFVILPE